MGIDDQHQRPLLATKLEPPPLPAGVVARPRVAAALAALDVPYVQVVAGPGYGKSLAVRQALAEVDGTEAWVALDAIDDGMTGFWAYVIEALRRASGRGDEAAAMHAEGAPVEAWLTALLRDLETADDPVALVLDDLHVIRSREVLAALVTFVERLPRSVRVLATSRIDPPLPFARWHLAGRAAEIRQDVLRFSRKETRELVASMDDVHLDLDAIDTLVERTEGWAAGIQLSLLSLRGRADGADHLRAAFPADRMVADYLVSEVLDGLPELDRQLLLDLSVLEDFDGPLAVHVSGLPDAGDRLRALEASGVLVLPVDENRTRLRFHPLLRDLLRQELRWRQPARIPDLHRRGAEHLAQHGHPRQAVQHLLAGGSLTEAFSIVIETMWSAFDTGDVSIMRQWLSQFSAEFLGGDVGRIADYVTLLVAAGEVDTAVVWLERFEDAEEGATPRQREEAAALRMLTSLWRGDIDRAWGDAARVVELHGSGPYAPPLVDRFPANMVRLGLHGGDLEHATRWLPAARDVRGSDVVALLPLALGAEVAAATGDLAEAEALARKALAFADETGMAQTLGAGEAHAALAVVHLERGELADADAANRASAEIFDALRVTHLLIRQRALAGRIAGARFGPRAGLDVLAASREAMRGGYVGRHGEALVAAAEAELLIADSATDLARERIATLPASPATRVLEARAHKRDGRDSLAVALLDLDEARTWEIPTRLDALLLLATCHRGPDAAALLREATELGVPRGYVRPFLAPGAELIRLLRSAQRTRPTLQIEAILRHVTVEAADDDAPIATYGTALTPREQALLALLPTHLTYREMANELCISVNTVKTNQKALYRKLHVTTRSDAVEAGRAAGYLRQEPRR